MPTLLVGDFIFVNKFAYGLRLPVLNTKVVPVGEPQRAAAGEAGGRLHEVGARFRGGIHIGNIAGVFPGHNVRLSRSGYDGQLMAPPPIH